MNRWEKTGFSFLVLLLLLAIVSAFFAINEDYKKSKLPQLLIYREKGETIRWQLVKSGSLRHGSGFLGGEEGGRIRLSYRDEKDNVCTEYRMGASSVLLVQEIKDLSGTKEFYNLGE